MKTLAKPQATRPHAPTTSHKSSKNEPQVRLGGETSELVNKPAQRLPEIQKGLKPVTQTHRVRHRHRRHRWHPPHTRPCASTPHLSLYQAFALTNATLFTPTPYTARFSVAHRQVTATTCSILKNLYASTPKHS